MRGKIFSYLKKTFSTVSLSYTLCYEKSLKSMSRFKSSSLLYHDYFSSFPISMYVLFWL